MAQKILIVHDKPDKLEILKDALEKGGYETVTISNKDEIVSKSRELIPNIILLDINLPIKEGYSICRELRESSETKDIKVIIIKNENNPQDKSWAVVKGSDFYFATKNPFSEDNLIESMSEMD